MNIKTLKEREDKDQCSAPRCRATSSIIYSPGATPANAGFVLSLCNEHHAEFLLCPESRKQSEPPPVPSMPHLTHGDVEKMFDEIVEMVIADLDAEEGSDD